jgi:hypothetical protein
MSKIPDPTELTLSQTPEWMNGVIALTTTAHTIEAADVAPLILVSEIHLRCSVNFEYRRDSSSPWIVQAAGSWLPHWVSGPTPLMDVRVPAATGTLEVKAFGFTSPSINLA